MTARVVVVTGASAGIGRATVRRFARAGDRIGLIARGTAGLKAARSEAEELGADAMDMEVDVSRFDEVEAAATEVEAKLGPIDVWINNAMVSVFSPVKQMKADEYRRVIEVTYLGYVNGVLAVLPRMLARDRGTIVQVGSALAYRSIPLQSAYCAAKHAVKGFTESLRCELIHDGSRVSITMVNLPGLNTPQFEWVRSRMPRHPRPVPPIYQPEVAAQAVYWASLHPRRQLNVSAVTSALLFANKFIPSILDHYLAVTNYEAQQTWYVSEPLRMDNLYEPVDDEMDHGAHGEYDELAKSNSIHLWINTHRAIATSLAVGPAAAAWMFIKKRRSS